MAHPAVIGKKNWLFIGHPDAGQRSAIIYSLVVSCQRHNKDPFAYLRDVLRRLSAAISTCSQAAAKRSSSGAPGCLDVPKPLLNRSRVP